MGRVPLVRAELAVHDGGRLLELPVAMVVVVAVPDAGLEQHPPVLERSVGIVPHPDTDEAAGLTHLNQLLLCQVECFEPVHRGERAQGWAYLRRWPDVGPSQQAGLRVLHEQPSDRLRRGLVICRGRGQDRGPAMMKPIAQRMTVPRQGVKEVERRAQR